MEEIFVEIQEGNNQKSHTAYKILLDIWDSSKGKGIKEYYGDEKFDSIEAACKYLGENIEKICSETKTDNRYLVHASARRTLDLQFGRGDKVNYLGGQMITNIEDVWEGEKFRGTKIEKKDFKPVKNTFVWAINCHEMIRYVIQHEVGLPKEHFMADMGEDGFESIHSSQLDDDKKYIYCDEDELELVEKKKKAK